MVFVFSAGRERERERERETAPGRHAAVPGVYTHCLPGAGPAPVYIGFGSWGTHDKTAVTELILEALQRTGNRGILHRNTVDGRSSFPEHVYVDDNLPHEWLFPQ